MGVLDSAFRVAKSAAAPLTGGGAAPEVVNVSEVLLDLRVPEAVSSALLATLQEIGFGLRDSEAPDPYGSAMRRFTVAERGTIRRFLIHVPCSVLENFAIANRDALAAVPYAFPPESIVCIFSQECQVVEFTLQQLIEKAWVKQGVTGSFIPWRRVAELPQAQPHQRHLMISQMLRLENGAAVPPPGPGGPAAAADPTENPPPTAADLPPADTQIIRTIVQGLPDFQDARGRKILIQFSGLEEICIGMDLTGGSRTVAGELIQKLNKYGWIKDPPLRHALGVLLSYIVLNIPDLSPEDAGKLREMIKKHNLLPE